MILNEKQKELSFVVQRILKDKINDDKLSKELRVALKNKVPNMKIINCQSLRNDFVNFEKEELYWIVKFMINNNGKYNFNLKINKIEDYFEIKDIQDAENYYLSDSKDKDFMIIHNVDLLPDGETYVCSSISVQDVGLYWGDSRFNYRISTQREASLHRTGISQGYVMRPTLHEKNILEIKQSMLDNEFLYNTLTCNILQTGTELIIYDPIERTLTLSELGKNTTIDVIDGGHRMEASYRATQENPSLQGYFQLKIFHMDVSKAQSFVFQEQKSSPISEEKKSSLEQNKYNITTKLLNDKGNKSSNSIFMKITDVPDKVTVSRDAYCTISTISNVLKEQWNDVLLLQRDNNKVASFLVEYFNEITGLREEDFRNFKQKKSVSTSQNIFILYMSLGRKLFDKENWRELLESFMSDIDFNEQNPLWKELQITSKRDDKGIRNKIYSYIEARFEEYSEVI